MTATGTLNVRAGARQDTYQWNGDVEDRSLARHRFEELAMTGHYLMVAYTEPTKGTQVRSFDEVEDLERQHGTVTVEATTALVGG